MNINENRDKKELYDLLIELLKTLENLYELDWFHQLSREVIYSRLNDVKNVQRKVDHAMGGFSILYLFAVFESYFKPKYWKDYVKTDDEKVLRAYRHVRHSIAHGHHGLRVKPRSRREQEEYNAFDEAIDNELFSPKNIIELDRTRDIIIINPTVGIYLKGFMKNLAQHALAEVAKEI